MILDGAMLPGPLLRTVALMARVAAAVLLLGIATANADAPGLIVVVDGSNSMWAEIEGRNKIVVVQEALGRAFAAEAGGLSVGVVAYGATRQNACSDVGTVVPLAGMSPDEAGRAVRGIRPKGASPVASALRHAAEAGAGATPLTILLIADGTDNCGGDPVAAALETGAVVHVIGFDAVQPDTLTALSPLAEATGGSFTLASRLEDFEAAFAAAVLAAGTARPGAQAARPAPPADAAPAADADMATGSVVDDGDGDDGDGVGGPITVAQAEIPLPRERPLVVAPPTEGAGAPQIGQPFDLLRGLSLDPGDGSPFGTEASLPPQRLQLAARLIEGGEMLGSGVIWRIYRAQPALDGSFELVEESEAPTPVFTLPADDYIVHVAYGLASTARRVSVREGPADEDIDINAGGLRLQALGALDEPLPERQLTLSVYSSEQDEYGQRKLLVEQATPARIIRLNSGTYHVVSRYGDANSVMRADLRVQPGQLTDATIRHEAAEVTLKLVNETGGEALANTAWSILSPGGDVVKESFGAFPSHVLAAGEYSVVARHEGRLYTRDFNVEPGRDTEVEIIAQ